MNRELPALLGSKAYYTLLSFCNSSQNNGKGGRSGGAPPIIMPRGKFDSKVLLVKKMDGVGFVVENPSGYASQLADLNNVVGVRTC